MTRSWTINGRYLTQPLTGVQRYAHEIVRCLDGFVREGHPLTQGLDLQIVAPKGARDPATSHIPMRRAGEFGGHLWEQTVLPGQVGDGLLSLCNTGPVAARKQILCIHDVNTRLYPQSYALRFRLLHKYLVPAIARRSVRVSTVSAFSAVELVRFGISSVDNTRIIPNGHEHVLAWTPKHSDETRKAAGPNTIVVIGSPAPHKNVGMLLGLAPRLAALGFRLALVGGLDTRVFQAASAGTDEGNVTVLGRLSDNELAALLQSSLCLAFPSFVEGFGLPPLEAMVLGCPVVCSNRTSLPEVCGDAALLVSPDEPDAWLDAFKRLRADPGLRFKLAASGRARGQRFSWRESAEQYLEEMAAVDGVASTAVAA